MEEIWNTDPSVYAGIMAGSDTIQKQVHPYILRHLGDALTVLDYGCGDADLSVKIPAAYQLTLYDKSLPFIELARHRMQSRDCVLVSDNKMLREGFYDCVILCFVLMSVETVAEIKEIMDDVIRVKSGRGKIIIALTHPCFRQYRFSYLQTEYSNGRPFKYFNESDPFWVRLNDATHTREVVFKNYHFSLSGICNLLIDRGLRVERVDELGDWHRADDSAHEFPLYLFLHCR